MPNIVMFFEFCLKKTNRYSYNSKYINTEIKAKAKKKKKNQHPETK